MYEYAARIIRCVDGDTVHADVDFGCDMHRLMVLRFYGVNAPEMSTDAGKAAKAWLVPLIEGKDVVLRTAKDRQEKYGRYLATLFLPGQSVSVNDRLVAAGHAVAYMAAT